MKIAAGLLKADSGTVSINGYDINKETSKAKHSIGYVPDFFGVYDDLKVTEYMNFYCGIHKIPVDERSKIIDSLVELVNLSDKKEFYVDDLSRGMKQRLCLARALIHNPQFLILDEPASGLDPRSRVEVREILQELRDMGKTVLISSHILSELSELCTKIGIINKGKMVAVGSVEEIQEQMSNFSKIKIKVLGETQTAINTLRDIPSITKIVELNGGIEFSFNKNTKEDKANLLKELISRNIELIHFEETAGNLESIFMHLTKGDEKDD